MLRQAFTLVLRLTLLWRVYHVLRQNARACHTTTVYIENGTWLNTSRWLQNGFFGDLDTMPQLGKVEKTLDEKTMEEMTENPVVPNVPVIPNREQDCLCGRVLDEKALNELLESSGKNDTEMGLRLASADGGEKARAKIGGSNYFVNGQEDDQEAQRFFMRGRLRRLLGERQASSSTSSENEEEGVYLPWMAKIRVLRGNETLVTCNGVLVNARYVLTVAHCFCGGILVDCSSRQYPETPTVVSVPQKATMGRHGGPVKNVTVDLGFLHDNGKVLDPVASFQARLVIIYERYRQDDANTIGEGDLAVVELLAEHGIPKRSVLQPICLPPYLATDNEFHDVDCYTATPNDPFHYYNLNKSTSVCTTSTSNENQVSFISAFPPSRADSCVTDGIGPAQSGTRCQAQPCNMTMDKPNIFNDDNQTFCQSIYGQNRSENYPDILKFNVTVNDTKVFCYPADVELEHGWCREKCEGEACDEALWGSCSPQCQADIKVARKIRVQTFQDTMGDGVVCPKKAGEKHWEFCSIGIGSRPKTFYEVEGTFAPNRSLNITSKKPVARGHNFGKVCFEDAGSPVWKKHTFVNSYGMGLSLGVLTGLVSRHERRCDALIDPSSQILVHTRIRQPGKTPELLNWILNQIRGGACQDLKSLPNLD